MEQEKTLSDLQVGDEVVVLHYGQARRVTKVQGVSPNYIRVVQDYYDRSDGRLAGNPLTAYRIDIPSETYRSDIIRHHAVTRFQALIEPDMYLTLAADRLNAISDLLEEELRKAGAL